MNEIEKAIEHFRYGITHDIFGEPVTTYARLAVDALREKAKREKGGRTMNELKPCPFCGGESLLRELHIIGVAKTKHYIRECRHCKATFAHRFRSIKKANEAWNRRVILGSCENELIVRCENCKHYNRIGCSDGFGWCERMDRGTNDEFYCSLAERSEG